MLQARGDASEAAGRTGDNSFQRVAAHFATDPDAWAAAFHACGYACVRFKSQFECDRDAMAAHKAAQANLVRDLFGNPFRPVTLDPMALTPTVEQFAESVYDDRSFERLPILADALEEAGCTDAAILGHCRGPGPHARGCWVLDLLLGKQ